VLRALGVLGALLLTGGGMARAQLAITQPTTRLLVLPLTVGTADSATSIAVMDATRDRLAVLARYKVIVIPKAKLCEALQASGFPCDLLLPDAQARLLARLLSAHAYTTGTLAHSGAALVARVRVVDMGSSGFQFAFSATSAPTNTPAALSEAIAQRLNTIVRAGENARDCTDKRSKGQFPQALDAARKALAVEPDLPAAHLCVATVYEAQRLPADSIIAAALRATKGDSLNPVAWETLARAYNVKGDSLKAVDAFEHELSADQTNTRLRLAVADRLRQMKQYQGAVIVLEAGLALAPTDEKLLDLRRQICIEGQLWQCTLMGFVEQAQGDTTKLADSTFLRAAIGAAQQVPDTARLLMFSRAAVRHFPKSAAFWKALGQAYDMRGMPDSALGAYRQSLAIDPSDVNGALLVAKTIVDNAVYDTVQANRLKKDTVALANFRNAFADRLDTAKTYLARPVSAGDSAQQLSAAVIYLTGGSKLAQAGAYDRAYPWLEQSLKLVAARTPGDTVGPRQQIRVQASFWYGVSSVQPLFRAYSVMVKSKSCTQAKAVDEWLDRAKQALVTGTRVYPPTANAMLQNLAKLEAIMPQVKKQFQCKNF
jgi:tetratricopeptide (TPR) repeat protein